MTCLQQAGMLTSLVLTLQAPRELELPRNLGRASHALFLRLIEQRDAALAAALHEANGRRPFTCSGLIGGQGQGEALRLGREAAAWLRLTGLDEAVSGHLAGLAEGPPAEVELDGQVLRVAAATLEGSAHPWAGRDSYRALCERILHDPGPLPRRIALQFASPTTFRSQGVNVPVPLPHLVFGSLLERWQAFSPVAVNPEVRRYAQEMVALSRYELRTRILRFKEGSQQIGFVGEATFTPLNADRYWVRVLQLLVAFAFYAGVGARTALGMGQARALER